MNQLQLKLGLLLVVALGLALGFISWQSMTSARRLLQPEIGRKAETLARSVAGLTDRALAYGIPLHSLVGVRTLFQHIVERNPELSFAALLDRNSQVQATYGAHPPLAFSVRAGFDSDSGVTSWPVHSGDKPVASVIIGINPDFVRATFRDLWLDTAIITIVTTLIALELMAIAFGGRLHRALEGLQERLTALRRADLRAYQSTVRGTALSPAISHIDAWLTSLNRRHLRLCNAALASGNQWAVDRLTGLERRFGLGQQHVPALGRAAAIRAPLFLFMLAEELPRPFLPGYIKQFAVSVSGLSPELVISLPIVLFMAIVALLQPPLGTWTERYGRRRSLMLGALLGMLGFAGTAATLDMTMLLIVRGLTAVGFALVFVASQGHVIDTTRGAQRSRGLAAFVGAIMVAALCGPPIGGILADRLGSRATFLVAAMLTGCSLLLAWRTLPRATHTDVSKPGGPAFRWRHMRLIGQSPALLSLLFGCSLPAKMILTALCFFLLPLHLQAVGFDQAGIGRLQMLYPLAMVVLVTPFAGLAERCSGRAGFVVAGGLLAALATLYPLFGTNVWLIGALLLQLGIGQALSIASQSALVGELGQQLQLPVNESALYGIFRLIERSGSALGPALAGLLLARYGFRTTTVIIGAIVAAGATVFLVLVRRPVPATVPPQPPPSAAGA